MSPSSSLPSMLSNIQNTPAVKIEPTGPIGFQSPISAEATNSSIDFNVDWSNAFEQQAQQSLKSTNDSIANGFGIDNDPFSNVSDMAGSNTSQQAVGSTVSVATPIKAGAPASSQPNKTNDFDSMWQNTKNSNSFENAFPVVKSTTVPASASTSSGFGNDENWANSAQTNLNDTKQQISQIKNSNSGQNMSPSATNSTLSNITANTSSPTGATSSNNTDTNNWASFNDGINLLAKFDYLFLNFLAYYLYF
jgi:hypothetical protein